MKTLLQWGDFSVRVSKDRVYFGNRGLPLKGSRVFVVFWRGKALAVGVVYEGAEPQVLSLYGFGREVAGPVKILVLERLLNIAREFVRDYGSAYFEFERLVRGIGGAGFVVFPESGRVLRILP
ncbi:hypothetical protein [Pyrococcus kukulkanii]|uniref:Uncharacterized protein n=1 Tax=Pyrococcus kukulkanii TaxID=1609559 RepID=A0ABV4T993_9EURY